MDPIIPAALVDRLRLHADELGLATTPDEALKAAFLCHCELRDAVAKIENNQDSTDE